MNSLPPSLHAAGRTLTMRLAVCLAFALTMLTGAAARAQTWSGAAGSPYNWNTAGNWSAAVTPSATTVLTFTGTTGLSNNNDIAAGSSFKQLAFNSSAGAFTLGGNAVAFAAGGTNVIDNQSTNDQIVNLGISFAASGDMRLNPGASHKLTLNGTVAFGTQRFYLPSANVTAGTIVFNAANTGLGVTNAFYNLTSAVMRNTVYNATSGMILEVGNKNAFGDSASTGLQMNQGTVLRANTPLTGTSALVNSVAVGAGQTLTISGANNLEIAGKLYGVSNTNANTVAFTNTGTTTLSGGVYLTEQNSASINPTVTFNVDPNAGVTTISGAIADNSISGSVSIGSVTKNGTGAMRFSGANTYTGVTTVSAGTLYVNGTHTPTANSGRYLVSSSCTLGGTGTIKPFDTTGSLTGISVTGVLSPGDPSTSSGIGTLTLDGANSTRALASIETGGTLSFDLGGSSLGNDKLVLANAQTNDLYFNSNTINFTDKTSGNLVTGKYVLIHSNITGSFSGLTVSSGVITAGLTIGTGLSNGNYTGSQLQLVTNADNSQDIVLSLTSTVTPSAVAIGMNINPSGATGLRHGTDVAGPSSARFGNWNNFTGPATSGATVSTSAVVDSTGASVTGTSFTLAAGTGAASGATYNLATETSLTNDARLFNGVFDQYGGTSTLTVTGIPYSTYDVYFYVHDDGSARGGYFTVGSTTYYLKGGAGDPTSTGSGYVQSTATTQAAAVSAGYVKFTGLTGSSLTATFGPLNFGDSTTRLKFAGFQIVSTQSPVTTVPAAPTGVTLTPGLGQVTVSWNPSNTATSYIIYRSTSPSGPFTQIGTVDSFAGSYVDSTVTNGQTYYYEVVAANGVGSSAASASASATPVDPSTLNIIGVHLRTYNTYGMAVTDTAGVVRVGYWNNLIGPVLQGDVVSLGAGSVRNHLGTVLSNVAVSFTAGNTTPATGTGSSYTNSGTVKYGTDAVTVNPATNDANLYSCAFEQYDTTASSLSVTGIPYSSYDVIFYIYDGGSTAGGTITANSTSLSIRGGAGNPDLNGNGYVQSTDTATASTTTQQGNYVRFSSLSGNLTASLVAKNVGSSTQRLKIAGFQIISRDAYVAPTQAPAAPTLTAYGANSQVGLNWTASSTATSYKIYKAGILLATVSAPLQSYADAPVTNGTALSYTVSAVNSYGEGAQSTAASATPAAPSFTAATNTVYQWSLPLTPIFSSTGGNWPSDPQRRVYLWVPPTCTKVQGVVVGLHNMLEKPMFDDPNFRQACTDANLAILFIAPGDGSPKSFTGTNGSWGATPITTAINLDPGSYYSVDTVPSGTTATTATTTVGTTVYYSTDFNPSTGARFANQSEQAGAEVAALLTKFAAESGYTELQYAPILMTDHSAGTPFVWGRTVATSVALVGRVFAILPNKGTFPGNLTYANPVNGASLLGIPILHITSEWQEISSWGNTWELGDAPAMRGLRSGGTTALIGETIQPGTGHYEHSPEQINAVATFVKAVAAARIPANWSPTAQPTLNTIDPTTGYLVDVTKLGETTTAAPVAYNTWVGAGKDPLRAYWYIDQATAQAACDTVNAGFAKKPQMLTSYANSTTTTPTSLAALNSGGVNGVGYVPFSPSLQSDGITFQARATSVNQSPVVRLYNAGPVGISSSPIYFRANGSGSLKQTGADTFRVWLDRESVAKGGQPWEPFVLAYQPADANYRSAYRPIQLLTAVAVAQQSGTAQTVTFPSIANQVATNLKSLSLSATATSGKAVQFWIASGPYRVDETDANGAKLIPDTIPPKSKIPMRVVVGAWQWGAGGYQSATPVYNEFWIGLPPVNLTVNSSGATTFAMSDLLSNAGFDTTTISSVSAASMSANGGTVSLSGSTTSATLTYTPPSGFTGTDSFTYTITLASGGTSTWTANVKVKADPGQSMNITKTEMVGGNMHIVFYGIPGTAYRVEYTNSLTSPNWMNLGTATEDGGGQYEFTDTTASGQPSRFYRVAYP